MGLQVTASKSALLLNCARPFSPETHIATEPPSEAMLYGSAFHELLEFGSPRAEKVAEKWGVPHLAEELQRHAIQALSALRKWLRGENVWKEPFKILSKENHIATRWSSVRKMWVSRMCEFNAETHHYSLRNREFGGTPDLVAMGSVSNKIVVLDYKTGDWGKFHNPQEIPQMLTLALQTGATAVAIMHAPREAPVSIYAEDCDPGVLEAHGKRLRQAMRKIGDGSLRPGPWCARCPAREGCPAKDSELLKRTNAMIQLAVSREELSKPVDKGAFHMFLAELGKLEKRAREVLKADVKGGEIIARPDGKVLVIKEKEYETLSKSSIMRALGKAAGEKMIAKLRKMGCVESDTREELWAVSE